MKAMSLEVLRGIIDQVSKVVRVKWVQPRVLNPSQITALRDRLQTWATQVDDTIRFMESSSPELFTSQA